MLTPGSTVRQVPYTSAFPRIVGQHLRRDVEGGHQAVVPLAGVEVHQHGAAGVGHVGDVDAHRRVRR